MKALTVILAGVLFSSCASYGSRKYSEGYMKGWEESRTVKDSLYLRVSSNLKQCGKEREKEYKLRRAYQNKLTSCENQK